MKFLHRYTRLRWRIARPQARSLLHFEDLQGSSCIHVALPAVGAHSSITFDFLGSQAFVRVDANFGLSCRCLVLSGASHSGVIFFACAIRAAEFELAGCSDFRGQSASSAHKETFRGSSGKSGNMLAADGLSSPCHDGQKAESLCDLLIIGTPHGAYDRAYAFRGQVQALAKGADTAEEAVSKVQQGLSKLDKLGKKEKGAAATLWFLRDKVPQFANFSENREEAELEAHCQSGRVQYRECPTTWGVWEYRDNHDFVKETSGRRSRNWSRGQEFHLEDDDEQEEGLENFFALDVEKLLGLTEGKGKGKGQQQEEGQLALQDGSTAEEKDDDVQAYLGKAKKARDLLSAVALAKAKASSYCSAASQKDAKKALADLDGLQKTKGVVSSKRACKKEAVVSLLQQAAATVNQAKDLGKELLAMAAKTPSKSSKLK
ncbi:unnamed protein product [Symbiodinium sp. CCMP2592]|nr:unnamed protein product [Symbiodinium sp. CCMP2592]